MFAVAWPVMLTVVTPESETEAVSWNWPVQDHLVEQVPARR